MEQQRSQFTVPSSSNDGSISPMSSVPDVIMSGKNTVAFAKSNNNSQQVARCLNNNKQQDKNKNSSNMLELDLTDYQSCTPKSPVIDLEVDDLKTMLRSNFYLRDKKQQQQHQQPVCYQTEENFSYDHRSSLVIKMRLVFQLN